MDGVIDYRFGALEAWNKPSLGLGHGMASPKAKKIGEAKPRFRPLPSNQKRLLAHPFEFALKSCKAFA